MKLSVVSHNTQKGVVRRKICRFSSKLSPEVLSFVSYACLKVFAGKKRRRRKKMTKSHFRSKRFLASHVLHGMFVSILVNSYTV